MRSVRPRPGASARGGGSALWLALVLAAAGCAPGGGTARETVTAYLGAVQAEDFDGLFCLLAGAAESTDLGPDAATRRAAFDDWARAGYAAYYEGRDRGWVEPDEHGIGLVKMFALGKGTYYELTEATREGRGVVRARMDVRFGYSSLSLSRLSPGTTFYVCGAPIGRIHPIRVPPSGEATAEVLATASLEWTLTRRAAPADRCAPGWTVASVRPLAEGLTTEEITWVF